jgi:hypothetical protein
MDNTSFDARLAAIESLLESGERRYRAKNMGVIWRPLFGTPFDRLMTDLVTLYLEADESQRHTLTERMEQYRFWREGASYFICRITARVRTASDAHWVRVGLSAALLAAGRVDYRDLIIALVLLRYVAEQRGINTQALFDETLMPESCPIKDILLNARNHAEHDVLFTVRTFGMPPLADEFFSKEAEGEPPIWRKLWQYLTGS